MSFLQQYAAVTNLEIVSSGLTVFDCNSMAPHLSQLQNLRTLSLDHNNICDGALSIFKSLMPNQELAHVPPRGLQKLSIRFCGITPKAESAIAQFVKLSPELTSLNLQGNHLSDAGIRSLGDAITCTSSLQTLNLALNGIRDNMASSQSSLTKLCLAMQQNNSISELDLTGNYFGNQGLEKIVDLLKKKKQDMGYGRCSGIRISVPGKYRLIKKELQVSCTILRVI